MRYLRKEARKAPNWIGDKKFNRRLNATRRRRSKNGWWVETKQWITGGLTGGGAFTPMFIIPHSSLSMHFERRPKRKPLFQLKPYSEAREGDITITLPAHCEVPL